MTEQNYIYINHLYIMRGNIFKLHRLSLFICTCIYQLQNKPVNMVIMLNVKYVFWFNYHDEIGTSKTGLQTTDVLKQSKMEFDNVYIIL